MVTFQHYQIEKSNNLALAKQYTGLGPHQSVVVGNIAAKELSELGLVILVHKEEMLLMLECPGEQRSQFPPSLGTR